MVSETEFDQEIVVVTSQERSAISRGASRRRRQESISMATMAELLPWLVGECRFFASRRFSLKSPGFPKKTVYRISSPENALCTRT